MTYLLIYLIGTIPVFFFLKHLVNKYLDWGIVKHTNWVSFSLALIWPLLVVAFFFNLGRGLCEKYWK